MKYFLIELSRNSFEFQYVVGKGGFGKVWKVVYKKYKKLYALKEMSKAKIIDKKSEKSVKYERELLAKIKHPYMINLFLVSLLICSMLFKTLKIYILCLIFTMVVI
jgi:serine/threonine protein kinase